MRHLHNFIRHFQAENKLDISKGFSINILKLNLFNHQYFNFGILYNYYFVRAIDFERRLSNSGMNKILNYRNNQRD